MYVSLKRDIIAELEMTQLKGSFYILYTPLYIWRKTIHYTFNMLSFCLVKIAMSLLHEVYLADKPFLVEHSLQK